MEFATTESAAGFTHPGVSVTAENLANVRHQIQVGAEPWATYFTAMSSSPAAATTVTSSNASTTDPKVAASTAFDSQGFNGRFIADGLKAYTQALMYVFTGEQVYRTNAMRIIRIWEQMDPAKYAEFADSHIHTGIPLNRMVTAAEILRYGSCAGDETPWTDADTTTFSRNLITPVIATFQSDQNHFMNQHLYPLLGAMAGYIFLDDAQGYAKSVEWFTVNSTANDQGFNGAVKRIFRLVERDDATGQPVAEPRVQHVEMGRDQAHGGGDITNAYILARLMMAQGTKVDPAAGTISSAPGAVGPYEFLDDRILAAADYFWKYMLGYDVDWMPVGYAISPDGTVRDTYDRPSEAYRGRFNTAGFWDLYYYYTYERGVDLTTVAPYYAEAFSKRLPPDYYYRGAVTRAWDNVDGGGDFWLFTPAEAAGTPVPKPQTSATTLQVEDRYTTISGAVKRQTEGDTSFVRLTSAAESAKIAFLNGSTTNKRIALKVRADEATELRLSFGVNKSIIVPATGGQWRQIVIDLTGAESLADLVYIETIGDGGSVDVDSILVDTASLNPVRFKGAPERAVTVAGNSVTATLPAEGGSGAALKYESSSLPAGAQLDATTGRLQWSPSTAGQYEVVISVSDGTTVSAQRLQLIAGADRGAALQLARVGHDTGTVYTRSTDVAYAAASDKAQAALGAESAAFQEALTALTNAVDALRLVSPKTALGSLDYPSLVATSTAGASTSLLVDDNPQTGTVYGQAVNLSHVFDFGPFARVRADRFALRSNIFEDRLANSAVFGSNDGASWTRLTPAVTTMTQDMQYLDVAQDLRDDTFQYIKVQLLKPLPDLLYGNVQNLFEITEFHIFGERSEAVGELTSVALSAPNSLKNRVVAGSTVALDFTASAPITGVKVTIAGADAPATSSDGGRTWKATATLPATVTPGAQLPFTIDHTTSAGLKADTVVTTSDGSSVYVSSDQGLVDQTLQAAPVTAAAGTANPTPAAEAAKLFDKNIATFTDTRLSNGRAALVWDLGEGASMSIRGVDVLVRQDQYGTSRLSTLRYEGSSDGTTWTRLTSSVQATLNWQRLSSISDQGFRFIRLTNGNIINLAETRVFGTYTAPANAISSVKMSSSNPLRNYAVAGDTVTLDITTTEAPKEISATIDGAPAAIKSAGTPTTFKATVILAASDRIGSDAAITVDHTTADGRRALTVRKTTDGSTVRIGTNKGLVTDLLKVASTVTLAGTPDPSTVARPQNLFDGSLTTYTDARLVNGSADIIFDLGTTRQIALDRVELAVRQDSLGVTRVKNMRLLGSNNLQQWSTLVTGVQQTLSWQGVAVDPALAGSGFRYLRLTNGDILNLAELRLYGAVTSPVASIAPVEVTTFGPEAPRLPATVVATRADGSKTVESVQWAAVDPSVWSTAGTVEVKGAVAGTSVPAVAKVTVHAVSIPAAVSTEATAPTGAVVTFVASADDNVTVACSPASGSTFPIGETAVACEATDAAGSRTTRSFAVTVSDTTGPSVRVPAAPIVREATGPGGAVVTYISSASDLVDGSVPVVCSPASGSTFALGTHVVACNAQDARGNKAKEAVFEVTVQDTTAPTVSVAVGSIVAEATGPNGAAVADFGVSASDLVDGTVPVSCDREPGSIFALGQTTVHCTATDKAGNTGTESVSVTVKDTTAPSIAWAGGPADGGTYPFDQLPAAPTCSATDAVDETATCSVTGFGTGVGPHTLTATAKDGSGNTSTETRSYTVAAWRTGGFYAPVDGNGVWNTVKGGATVPLKFELFAGGTELTSTSAVASFTYGAVTCGSANDPTDEIEVTTTGGTSLRYDATAGQFIQNWQTPKSAGVCYKVKMTARDGSIISALFKLR
ncbi:PxKF domain-containing protein [Microbacterium sp. F51-2R]|uniref:PxKF domain-containing protein n=1 Tax=Microbacterium sp. F51-2R TaxID=3445777 RepID=UPI003FA011D3